MFMMRMYKGSNSIVLCHICILFYVYLFRYLLQSKTYDWGFHHFWQVLRCQHSLKRSIWTGLDLEMLLDFWKIRLHCIHYSTTVCLAVSGIAAPLILARQTIYGPFFSSFHLI